MIGLIDIILEATPYDLITDQELMELIPGSADRRYGVVKRAMAQGELIHIRRGLYILAEKYRRRTLNLFSVAHRIYSPSYISMESALSYHGWIPEAVYSVTAVSLKRSKIFETPLGNFHFHKVISKPFLAEVERIVEEGNVYFMANPWKAIADYVTTHKKDWRGFHPLIHSLRIDEENLLKTKEETIQKIEKCYRNQRVLRFLKSIRKELKQ